ncbi:hypothetical protein AAC691_17195 [Nguyenibacter vanlangensis]|uniref:Uncharacterized protein n=1 Tax=Nguyenibacter vanlangensis TaxID=1216886 RepID=A0ABZ3D2L1_9PROT
MDRSLRYSNPLTAPTFESVKGAILKKYGSPSSATETPSSVDYTWAYGPRGKIANASYSAYDMAKSGNMCVSYANEGLYLVLTISVTKNASDPSRAELMTVNMNDNLACKVDGIAMTEQLFTKAKTIYDTQAKAGAGPAL